MANQLDQLKLNIGKTQMMIMNHDTNQSEKEQQFDSDINGHEISPDNLAKFFGIVISRIWTFSLHLENQKSHSAILSDKFRKEKNDPPHICKLQHFCSDLVFT